MKARFVYENLEFERGRDPKSALGIGVIDKFGFSAEAKKFILTIWKAVEQDKNEKSVITYVMQDSSNSAVRRYSIKIISSIDGGLRYFKKIFDEAGFDVYLDPDQKPYINKYQFQGKPFKEAWFYIDPKYFDILAEIREIGMPYQPKYTGYSELLYPLYNVVKFTPKTKSVYEKLDFERGKEPKDALKVGRAGIWEYLPLFKEIHEYCENDGFPGWKKVSPIEWNKKEPTFKAVAKTDPGLRWGQDKTYDFDLMKNEDGGIGVDVRFLDKEGAPTGSYYTVSSFQYWLNLLRGLHTTKIYPAK